MVKHPSGLSEDYVAFVSMEFWMHPDNIGPNNLKDPLVWDRLLAFQQGYAAAVKRALEYHQINL